MATDLFLGSLAVLTLAAVIIIAMTSSSRVDMDNDEGRGNRRDRRGD